MSASDDATRDPPTIATEVENRPVFAIFEGGGAKGITHVGAVKAAEDVGIDFFGVAGTSAGAIVAALVAVGVKADRLFDPAVGGDDIFTAYDASPVALLGARDWRVFRLIRRLRWLALPLLLVPLLLSAMLLAGIAGLIALCGLAGPWRVLRHFGFFDSTGARDLLDKVLRTEIATRRGVDVGTIPAPLCFADIDPAGDPNLIRLKIVVTNVDRRALEVFDAATPNVAVADAVVASFSIPFVFRPARVRGSGNPHALYVDGGLVGNLPIWVFNEEKRRVERDRMTRPPLAIVAFTLADASEAGPGAWWPARAIAYLASVVRSGVFGSQTVVRTLVPDLFILDMPSPINVLAFDCDRQAAIKAYSAGHETASRILRRDLRNAPEAARQRLLELLDDTLVKSRERRDAMSQSPLPQLRIGLAVPFGKTSLRIRISAGMDKDADDRLSLDMRAPGAPQAYRFADITLTDFGTINRPDLHMTKYEAALVRPGLASLLSIPIFAKEENWQLPPADRSQPLGVLCIDSDASLAFEYDDGEFLHWIVENAASLALIVAELNEREVDE